MEYAIGSLTSGKKLITFRCEKGLLGSGEFVEEFEFSDDATEMEIEQKCKEWIKEKCEFIRLEYQRKRGE